MRKKTDAGTPLGTRNYQAGRGDITEFLMLEAAFDARQPFCERMLDRLADGLFRFHELHELIQERHDPSLDDVARTVGTICSTIDTLMKRYAD